MNELYRLIEQALTTKDRVVVAIDGMSASGKTSLANKLKSKYNATIFHMDDFFLPFERKTPSRMSEAGGNVDYERIYSEIHSHLSDDVINYNRFSCKNGELYPDEETLNRLIIIEGVYSMRLEFRKFYDISVFMEISSHEQINRILKRNGESMVAKFVYEWIPLEHKYFNALNVKEACDVVIGE